MASDKYVWSLLSVQNSDQFATRTVEDYNGDTEVTPSTSSSTSEENRENRVKEDVTEEDTETTPMETSKTVRRNKKQEHRLKGRNLQIKL